MEAAEFDEVEVKLVSRDLSVASFDDLWAMVTTGAPPVKMLLEQAGAAGRTRLQDTLGRIVEQRFGGGPIQMTNVATVGRGNVR